MSDGNGGIAQATPSYRDRPYSEVVDEAAGTLAILLPLNGELVDELRKLAAILREVDELVENAAKEEERRYTEWMNVDKTSIQELFNYAMDIGFKKEPGS